MRIVQALKIRQSGHEGSRALIVWPGIPEGTSGIPGPPGSQRPPPGSLSFCMGAAEPIGHDACACVCMCSCAGTRVLPTQRAATSCLPPLHVYAWLRWLRSGQHASACACMRIHAYFHAACRAQRAAVGGAGQGAWAAGDNSATNLLSRPLEPQN